MIEIERKDEETTFIKIIFEKNIINIKCIAI